MRKFTNLYKKIPVFKTPSKNSDVIGFIYQGDSITCSIITKNNQIDWITVKLDSHEKEGFINFTVFQGYLDEWQQLKLKFDTNIYEGPNGTGKLIKKLKAGSSGFIKENAQLKFISNDGIEGFINRNQFSKKTEQSSENSDNSLFIICVIIAGIISIAMTNSINSLGIIIGGSIIYGIFLSLRS